MNLAYCTFGLLLQISFSLAQSQSPAPSVSPQPNAPSTIKVTTRLVQINVVVHDHHGNPVADLKKEDFEVKDAGKSQTINFLAVDTLQPSKSASVKSAKSVMPSNMATNRPTSPGTSLSSVTVLLLDLYNTKLTDQIYARKQVIKFLKQIRPDDRIALYLLNGKGFSVVHDFTNNSESLLTSIAKVLPGFSHELDSSEPDASNTGDEPVDSMIDTSNTMMSNFYLQNRALNTSVAFKTLAEHLAGVPGRKNVVWVSGGFPINFGYGDPQAKDRPMGTLGSSGPQVQDQGIFTDYIEAASRAMNTANVAVYPVDARGLLGLPMADASKSFKLDPRTHQLPQSAMTVDRRNMDTMDYIAELTGGKAFYNTNDLQNAIREAINDSAVTYTIGYYVSGDDWDGKYHKIKVKVLRSGVNVRTKKGYFAQEAALTSTNLDKKLREAVWSPLDSTSLEITARIDPSPAVRNASRIDFALDPAQLVLSPEKDAYQDLVDVLYVQQTKQGKSIVNLKHTLHITLSEQQLPLFKTKGFTSGSDLEINAQTEAVRIVVLDHGSGLAGSVTLPVGPASKSGATVAGATGSTTPPK